MKRVFKIYSDNFRNRL